MIAEKTCFTALLLFSDDSDQNRFDVPTMYAFVKGSNKLIMRRPKQSVKQIVGQYSIIKSLCQKNSKTTLSTFFSKIRVKCLKKEICFYKPHK